MSSPLDKSYFLPNKSRQIYGNKVNVLSLKFWARPGIETAPMTVFCFQAENDSPR